VGARPRAPWARPRPPSARPRPAWRWPRSTRSHHASPRVQRPRISRRWIDPGNLVKMDIPSLRASWPSIRSTPTSSIDDASLLRLRENWHYNGEIKSLRETKQLLDVGLPTRGCSLSQGRMDFSTENRLDASMAPAASHSHRPNPKRLLVTRLLRALASARWRGPCRHAGATRRRLAPIRAKVHLRPRQGGQGRLIARQVGSLQWRPDGYPPGPTPEGHGTFPDGPACQGPAARFATGNRSSPRT